MATKVLSMQLAFQIERQTIKLGHALVQLSQRNLMQLMCFFLFYETERVYDDHKNVTNVTNAAPVLCKQLS